MPGIRVTSGERLALRTCEEEDIQFRQRSVEPEIRRLLGNPVRTQDQFSDSSKEGTDRFVVSLEEIKTAPSQADEDDIEPIGLVRISDINYKRPELGYWLIPEVHREGYGSEAVSLAIDYVFDEYNTQAVGAKTFDFNDASRGLLESLGFSEEGCLRKFRFVNGDYHDMIYYGLLRSEW
jgi:ribosomal-protein-alanine N-acetyltransferase